MAHSPDTATRTGTGDPNRTLADKMADGAREQIDRVGHEAEQFAGDAMQQGPRGRGKGSGSRQPVPAGRRAVPEGSAHDHAGGGRRGGFPSRRALEALTSLDALQWSTMNWWRTVIDRVEAVVTGPKRFSATGSRQCVLPGACRIARRQNSEEIIRDLRELQARCEEGDSRACSGGARPPSLDHRRLTNTTSVEVETRPAQAPRACGANARVLCLPMHETPVRC